LTAEERGQLAILQARAEKREEEWDAREQAEIQRKLARSAHLSESLPTIPREERDPIEHPKFAYRRG
jgi:hypothetical protein